MDAHLMNLDLLPICEGEWKFLEAINAKTWTEVAQAFYTRFNIGINSGYEGSAGQEMYNVRMFKRSHLDKLPTPIQIVWFLQGFVRLNGEPIICNAIMSQGGGYSIYLRLRNEDERKQSPLA